MKAILKASCPEDMWSFIRITKRLTGRSCGDSKQHRIGAVVQATGTGKSYLLARYIADHAKEKILVFAPNITILDEIRKAVGFSIPQVTYRTFQSLIRNREDNGLLRADHILIDEFHHFGAEIGEVPCRM